MSFRAILTYLAIVAGTVLVLESAVRIWDWEPRLRADAIDDGLGLSRYYHAASGVGDLVPNQNGHWVVWFRRPYNVQTNSLGLRNVEEPAPGSFRIVAMGDSQTLGPYLANEDTWPAWLQTWIRQANRNSRPVQVFNAGISGYSIGDKLALFREKIVPFRPGLVLLAVFENDVSDLARERHGLVQRETSAGGPGLATRLKIVARNSAVFARVERWVLRRELAAVGIEAGRGETGGQSRSRVAEVDPFSRYAGRYESLFADLAGAARDAGIPLSILYLPASDVAAGKAVSPVEQLVRSLSARHGLPYLDLTTALTAADTESRNYLLQWNEASRRFEGNGHFSREGNLSIGKEIARWLQASEVLP
jgi:lysophospholipase L1-like esterase